MPDIKDWEALHRLSEQVKTCLNKDMVLLSPSHLEDDKFKRIIDAALCSAFNLGFDKGHKRGEQNFKTGLLDYLRS